MSRREDEWDEAKFAIQETGAWVRHTDTKAAVLAAGAGVIAASVLSQADEIAGIFKSGVMAAVIASVFVGATMLSLTLTLHYLFAAIRPRVNSSNSLNRFAWPNLAQMTGTMRSGHYKSSATEGWAQASELAKLAADKYKEFGTASRWFAVFLTSSVAVVTSAFVF